MSTSRRQEYSHTQNAYGVTAPTRSTSPEQRPHQDAVVYLVQEPTIPKHTGRVIDTTPLLWWGKVRYSWSARRRLVSARRKRLSK
jgi:hypothetical protein